ncbi:MAG: sulfotransferase [Acidimicrobiia bacterium]|nr:sulfotransferase [Acidimicrobiia bacterium]
MGDTLSYFVIGMGRSGSTVLGSLLARAVDGFYCGELHLLWQSWLADRLCTCGTSVRTCPVWGEVVPDVMRASKVSSVEVLATIQSRQMRDREVLLRPRWRDDVEHVALRRHTEEAVRRVAGTDVLVDTSHSAAVAYVAKCVAEALQFIHLVRDPRAVAFSSARPKHDPSMQAPMPSRSPMDAALRWMGVNLAAERLLRGVGEDTAARRLRYEDFVHDPTGSVPELALLNDVVVHPTGCPLIEHSIAGNPGRFQRDQPLRLDERWKSMPPSERRQVELITFPLMLRYGYPLRVSGSRDEPLPR